MDSSLWRPKNRVAFRVECGFRSRPLVRSRIRGTRTGELASRAWDLASREFGHRPFLVLLALGVLVRVAVTAMYFPAWMQSVDSVRFARIGPMRIFGDYWMPAGYALFARTLRKIIPMLWVSIAIQHLIGLLVGIVLYLATRRLGAKPWLACVAAAVALLSGDHVWLEHQIMSDSFMTAFIAAGLACTVRGLVPDVDLRWLVLASALLMVAALSRNVGLLALPIMVLCLAFWVRGPVTRRAQATLAATLPGLLVLGIYVAAFELNHGQYLGLMNMSGWNLYARVAPFADCSKFTPPPGTSQLCESTPPSQRQGSLAYEWDPNTIGRRQFSMGPATNSTMGRFAWQVILHQPGGYLRTVLTDAARYINPKVGPQRPLSGQPRELLSFGLIDPDTKKLLVDTMARGYTGTNVHVHGRQILTSYQNLFRVGGLALAALVIFTILGMVVAQGPVRLGVFLFGLTGLALYLVPVMTLSYDFRYGIPPETFVAVSGTLGAAAALARRYPRGLFD